MRSTAWLPVLLLLTSCNWIGNVTGLSKDANKAVGAACRQSGRSLEQCYLRNPEADKAQIYAGWREMHEYMTREHLQTMAPPPDPPPPTPEVASAPRGQAPAADATSSRGSAYDDAAAKNDPEVAAVMSVIRNQHVPASGVRDAKDQKALLDTINQLNNARRAGGASAPRN
ncbi:hypothetical protein [Paludibacterium yongneupense]|uniref:hypothetical protein n=1 Tax=Paludibacterium yongneupense TaxID=400061 RepID=UPI00040C5A48|nr:hypothetical protein [Paludibacterium yongneupense]